MVSRFVPPADPLPEVIATGHAHGKVILLGEHTVVHGTPAIAFPVPAMGVDATARWHGPEVVAGQATDPRWESGHRFLGGDIRVAEAAESGPRIAVCEALRRWKGSGGVVDIGIDCDIPAARGLGSSAGCAVAAVRAVANLCDTRVGVDEVYGIVQHGEQYAHGRASGVDARAALASSPIWFEDGVAHPLHVTLDADIVVADTGMPSSTERAVAIVGAKLDDDPTGTRRLLAEATELIQTALDNLALGRAGVLGATLIEFHSVLTRLGISTPELERLITTALGAGALGAKLTGGGLGGCIVALTATAADTVRVRDALLSAGAIKTWTIRMNGPWP